MEMHGRSREVVTCLRVRPSQGVSLMETILSPTWHAAHIHIHMQ